MDGPQSHWVVERMGVQSPVYKVKPESGVGSTSVLHRNVLLPCDALELDAPNLGFGARPRKTTAAEKQPLSVSGNDLQNSGEEDDFSNVDLEEEISTEVRASKSVSPEEIQSRIMRLLRRARMGRQKKCNLRTKGVLKLTKLNNQRGKAFLRRTCGLGRSARADRRRS